MAVEVRGLVEGELAAIEAREPTGKGYIRAVWTQQRAGAVLVLVAWVDGIPVGSGVLDLRASPVELKNLAVDAGCRGKGVGTSLIGAAEQRLGPGASLAVGVDLDNPRARALYERLGYRATGRLSTTTYAYVDDAGVRRQATETDELLVKTLP